MANFLLSGGQRLMNVHPPTQCAGGYCAIHNPSPHHMRDWDQFFDAAMYRVCEHDVAHPDPDEPWGMYTHVCCPQKCCVDSLAGVSDGDIRADLKTMKKELEL